MKHDRVIAKEQRARAMADHEHRHSFSRALQSF
jgi:hypothetical protein